MAIDWQDPSVSIPELLTSPHPLERIKGEVYGEVRANPNVDGDMLFIEKTQDFVQTSISQSLTGYVSSVNSQQAQRQIKNTISDVINTVYADIDDLYDTKISITTDALDPANIKVDVITTIGTEEENG